MTRLFTYAVSIFFLVSSLQDFAQNYDYLLTATDTGNGSTTNNSQAWTDLTSVTVDVTNISYLYLSATINMSPDGSNNSGREGNYNIYQSDDPTNNSGIIKRQIIQNSEPGVESWGLGAIVHIFDVSALTGNKTFTLEHSNQSVSSNGRNVYSFARLSAVALTTTINGHELSNDCKTLSTYVSTTSSTYTPIPGLESDAISLPFKGDIYVALSINGKANSGGTVAEYKLEYSTDNGATYPITIASNVPNEGQWSFITPNHVTTIARVMVISSNGTFFDVSNVPHKIQTSTGICSLRACSERSRC